MLAGSQSFIKIPDDFEKTGIAFLFSGDPAEKRPRRSRYRLPRLPVRIQDLGNCGGAGPRERNHGAADKIRKQAPVRPDDLDVGFDRPALQCDDQAPGYISQAENAVHASRSLLLQRPDFDRMLFLRRVFPEEVEKQVHRVGQYVYKLLKRRDRGPAILRMPYRFEGKIAFDMNEAPELPQMFLGLESRKFKKQLMSRAYA